MAVANKKQVQPIYEWGLDPIHWTYAKLFIRDVFGLGENKIIAGTYHLYSHIILRVCIMGYVVSVAEKEKMFLYVVDDGTGLITCCNWKTLTKEVEDTINIELGALVKIWGKIREFRDGRQLNIEFIREERKPNAEALHWMEVIKLDELYNARDDNCQV